eukprot:m.11690 g.11690  ORF g.11690 m.11690 type:complete len:1093 (+) comp4504_c0_seq1:95-3373(+)
MEMTVLLFVVVLAIMARESCQTDMQREMRESYEKRYKGSEIPVDKRTQDPGKQDDGIHEIFLLPHAHCDVGWLYTVDGYFNLSVSDILTTVVADLAANPTHRFIWSEVKWIQLWWPHQNSTTQDTFRSLVYSGQFELVGGGWSQHDEVTPSYRDMVANTVIGHEFLRSILGPLERACPGPGGVGKGRCIRFGWQIDMFAGYSAASPSLGVAAGYDGIVLRFEGPDAMRAQWDASQDYEFLWEGSSVLSSNRSRMAAHVIRWNYGDMLLTGRNGSKYGYRGPAVSFDFSQRVLFSHADVQRYARDLVSWSRNRGSVYRGNRHLAVWGSDFQFQNAGLWFEQMDQLIKEINDNQEVYQARIHYTTLSEYFDDLHTRQKSDKLFRLPVKKFLDFEFGWPHSWAPVGVPLIGMTNNFSIQYQTGAASSRPGHKQRVRQAASLIRTAQTSHALAMATSSLNETEQIRKAFAVAWDTLGIVQHHDSVPGTMQSAASVSCPNDMPMINSLDVCNRTTDPSRLVLEDYTKRLEKARQAANMVTLSSLAKLEDIPSSWLSWSLDTNHSKGTMIFNPSPQTRSEVVRIAFEPPGDEYANGHVLPTVYRHDRTAGWVPVLAQMVLNDDLVSQLTTSHKPTKKVLNELYIIVEDMLPYSRVFYSLEFSRDKKNSTTTFIPEVLVGKSKLISTGMSYENNERCLQVKFNDDGLMDSITTRTDNLGCKGSPDKVIEAKINQHYMQYLDGSGGSYCLIEQQEAVSVPRPYSVALTRGPVMQEVVQRYSYGNGLEQRVRIPNITSNKVVEVQHKSGRLGGNRELVSRFTTDIQNTGVLHTEASGFSELYPRKHLDTGSIAQNYHAMVQTAAIRDEDEVAIRTNSSRQLTIITSRTMGVASLHAGEVEYMLQRRIISGSDNQGPWPLDDQEPRDDIVRIMLGEQEDSEKHRFAEGLKLEHPFIRLYTSEIPVTNNINHHLRVAPALPEGVWLEVFVRGVAGGDYEEEKLSASQVQYAVHLQNTIASGSNIRITSLKDVLGLDNISGCMEMTLALQQSRQENDQDRLHWMVQNESYANPKHVSSSNTAVISCDSPFTLAPLDLRTFVFST